MLRVGFQEAPMRVGYQSTLQRTMIVYFLLIGFASCLVGTEFVLDVHKKELRTQLIQNFQQFSHASMPFDEAFRPLLSIRNKAILMVAVILFVVVIVLSMFIKNITEPLQHMIEVSKEISRGDLSRTVKIHAQNELSELGSTVNELTSNLQELILLSEDLSHSSKRFMGRVEEIVDRNVPEAGSLESVRQEMGTLSSKINLLEQILHGFKLYGIERA
jgi:methyl-accepting chemotaxis protein